MKFIVAILLVFASTALANPALNLPDAGMTGFRCGVTVDLKKLTVHEQCRQESGIRLYRDGDLLLVDRFETSEAGPVVKHTQVLEPVRRRDRLQMGRALRQLRDFVPACRASKACAPKLEAAPLLAAVLSVPEDGGVWKYRRRHMTEAIGRNWGYAASNELFLAETELGVIALTSYTFLEDSQYVTVSLVPLRP